MAASEHSDWHLHLVVPQATAQASLEAWRSEEARRLARERRVLEQQSKALLKLPSKKEKSALDALQQQLEQERSDARATAARHRLTVERLRCQIKELQVNRSLLLFPTTQFWFLITVPCNERRAATCCALA